MLRTYHYIYEDQSQLVYSDQQHSEELLIGAIPPIYPEYLGASAFQEKFRVRFNYISGSMAKGIASEDLVIEVARHGGLGFFGSAGLSVSRIADAIDKINYYLGDEYPFGVNLIHHLKDQQLEFDQVALFLEKGVRNIEASAFTSITPAAIWFAFKGIYLNDDGQIVRPNHVFAKISHEHVAESFLSPPDDYFLESLVALGHLSQYEASLAKNLPVAECVIVESDSGGHTDNRPSTALFPVIKLLTARLAAKFGYDETPFVGLAGGLGTPEAISAAFDIGADFCVIGSVHQSCVEAGTSAEVKKMLETAGLADYAMTPSPDMFEEGIKVQVLKKGTMMPIFGNRLFELYRQYQSLEELPDQVKQELETKIFKKTIAEVWEETMTYFISQDPSQLVQADVDPRHKMALVMRWYLGKSNQWSINGESSKRTDYQIWSGPALGAFNNWANGTFLEKVENREVGQVMLNLLEGAAHHKRIQQIKSFGITNVNQQKYVPKRLVPS